MTTTMKSLAEMTTEALQAKKAGLLRKMARVPFAGMKYQWMNEDMMAIDDELDRRGF